MNRALTNVGSLVPHFHVIESFRNGYVQALMVTALAAAVNVPKWLEFEYHHVISPFNSTMNISQVSKL